jgi:hypothetical protein
MNCATIQPAIKVLLTEIHARLGEAARIAKAAACAGARNIFEGISVSMDIEQPILTKARRQR